MIKSSISKTILISIASLMLTTGVVNADTKVISRQTSGGQTMEKLVVSAGSLEKFAHDEEDPAVADDVEATREAAVLTVRAHRAQAIT